MAEVQEDAKVKYAKQILDILDKELIDNRMRLNSAEVNARQLLEEQKKIQTERKRILFELSGLAIEAVEYESIRPGIFIDQKV